MTRDQLLRKESLYPFRWQVRWLRRCDVGRGSGCVCNRLSQAPYVSSFAGCSGFSVCRQLQETGTSNVHYPKSMLGLTLSRLIMPISILSCSTLNLQELLLRFCNIFSAFRAKHLFPDLSYYPPPLCLFKSNQNTAFFSIKATQSSEFVNFNLYVFEFSKDSFF